MKNSEEKTEIQLTILVSFGLFIWGLSHDAALIASGLWAIASAVEYCAAKIKEAE